MCMTAQNRRLLAMNMNMNAKYARNKSWRKQDPALIRPHTAVSEAWRGIYLGVQNLHKKVTCRLWEMDRRLDWV